MKTWEIILIAVSLAMDAFAVALAAGSSGYGRPLRSALRLSFHFGWFQFMMPVIGWWTGRHLEKLITAFDHWVAFALLAGVGLHMFWEARNSENTCPAGDPTRGMRMVTLSVATSLDALAVGISLAMVKVEIWYPSAVIGLVTGSLALSGILLGDRLHRGFGRQIPMAAGLILIGVGVRILLEGLNLI